MALVTPEGVRRKSLEPWIKDEINYYRHQVDGIRELSRRKSFILADDMGLGKSLTAETVFAIDVARGWASKMVVVCPSTLKGNWADELEKFTGFPYVVLDGTPSVRVKQLLEFAQIEGPKVLICNYEQVASHLKTLDSMRFDVAVFDEAHYLKNPKAKRTKTCLSLYSRRSFLLTGTPMLNHVNELWSLMHRVDPDGTPDYWRFVNRYVVFGGFKDKQIVGVKNEAELTERLQGIMLRRLKKDVLDLPEVQYIERRVDLLPEQRKIYNEVKTDLKLTRYDKTDPDDIDNALTKFLRLKQICGTTKAFTGEDHSAKLDLAIEDELEILENGHKTVVFTQFRDVQAAYLARLDKFGVPTWELHGDIKATDRPLVVKEWAMSKGPGVIVCMFQVAGVGLNMTAASHGSFLDQLYVPGLNQQAVDRMHRIGASETQPVQIRKYIARNTVESRILHLLRVKTRLNEEIVETDPDWKRKILEEMEGEE